MTELSLLGLRRAIGQGALTPAEAIRVQHGRLLAGHAALHCASWVAASAPAPLPGPLSGIALAHKDIFMLDGRLPGLGLRPGEIDPGRRSAEALRRLAAAGATVMGSLAMAEYACGSTGENAWLGRCLNPLDADAVVGASSSGSAAAVAAGLTLASLGTDTSGSVRIPAATCGLVGLKPTWGAIPTEGVHPLAPSLDTVGLLTRDCADAAYLFELLRDPATVPSSGRAIRVQAWLESNLHPEVAAALRTLAADLDAGESAFANQEFETLSALAEIVLRAEAAQTHRKALAGRELPPRLRDLALAGLAMPSRVYQGALRARPRMLRDFVARHLSAGRVLMLPALPRPVPDWSQVTPGDAAFEFDALLGLHRYMGFVNYLALPALVLPIAADSKGRPISVQLVAGPHREAELLSLAERIEAMRAGAGRSAAVSM